MINFTCTLASDVCVSWNLQGNHTIFRTDCAGNNPQIQYDYCTKCLEWFSSPESIQSLVHLSWGLADCIMLNDSFELL